MFKFIADKEVVAYRVLYRYSYCFYGNISTSNQMLKIMMHIFRFFALPLPLVLSLTAAIGSSAALANPPHSHEPRHEDRRNSDKRAVRDMVGEVEHNYRGHVVDVQPPAANDDMYRVRVLQEGGRVKTLRVPAKREHDRRRE
jgi:hypothetical protein